MLSECRDAIQAIREELKPDQVGVHRGLIQPWSHFTCHSHLLAKASVPPEIGQFLPSSPAPAGLTSTR